MQLYMSTHFDIKHILVKRQDSIAKLFWSNLNQNMASQILRRVLKNQSLDQQIHTQWTGPGNILSLLSLVGGDVVQRAIALQVDSSLPTPVVFSFGWVVRST